MFLVGCVATPPPAPLLQPLTEAADRPAVVLVPGITGIELRHRTTGEILWGTGANLIKPRDGGRSIALPIDPQAAAEDPLEAGEVLERVELFGLFRREVYSTIVELLETNGYRRGDLQYPRPGDNLFLFAYDWRRDNLESARLLAQSLARLRVALGLERLPVALICQSNGGYICRYATKYGSATLEEAEAGRPERPAGVEVRDLILVGTANGGSMRILREMNRGRKYLFFPLGRRWRPETLFTFRSLYQDLPADGELFVDAEGRALDVDVFDPAAWEKYGWSIYGARGRRRLSRRRDDEILGDPEARADYLARVLARARRFRAVLARDAEGFGTPRYHLIQSAELETPARAFLLRGKRGWRTLFSGDRQIDRRPALREIAWAPGDGHATLESQVRLSPQELESMAGETFFVTGGHFDLIETAATQQRFLEILLHSARAAGRPADAGEIRDRLGPATGRTGGGAGAFR